jgi:hypothetical protein
VLDPGLTRFVKRALPPAPARVLEVGAGDGELAAEEQLIASDRLPATGARIVGVRR